MGTSYAGQRVAVTGAASGIGESTARALAAQGAQLELIDIDPAKLEAVANACRALHVTVRTHLTDLGDAGQVETLIEALTAEPLDALISNAGVAVVAPFTETCAEDWDWILGVNLRGPLRLIRGVLPGMIARGRGQLGIVASLAGLVGAPGMVAYSTTKFGLVGFAEALRYELSGTGVDVTVLCPGYVRTNLHRATRYRNDGFFDFLEHAPGHYGLDRETVARKLLSGMANKRPLVVLGPEKFGWWLKRLAPSLAFHVTKWVARRTGVDGRGALRAGTETR